MVLIQRVLASHRFPDLGLGHSTLPFLRQTLLFPGPWMPVESTRSRGRGVTADYLSSRENIRELWASAIHMPGWGRRTGNLSFTAHQLVPSGLVMMSV